MIQLTDLLLEDLQVLQGHFQEPSVNGLELRARAERITQLFRCSAQPLNDWGFQHPSAVYWHCAVPRLENSNQRAATSDGHGAGQTARIVTYREFLKNNLSPRMLAQAIAEHTAGERIREVVLSPDAFAHRTCETSVAEQLGDVLEQNGLPRPVPADDDRVGGWQLMYQLLESDEWVITENCRELIDGLPLLVHDETRVEDIRKVDGDDAADAARYGIVSGVRYAGFGAHNGAPGAGQAPPEFENGTPRFVPGMPLAGAPPAPAGEV